MSRLCLSCGLCCNGALFARVALTGDEARTLAERVEVGRDSEGATVLRQPCRALRDRRCTVYADRPQACRAYVCQLVQRFSKGEVDFDTALDVVREARLSVGDVARALGPPRPGDPANTMTRAGYVWKDEARRAALSEFDRDTIVRARKLLLLAFGV